MKNLLFLLCSISFLFITSCSDDESSMENRGPAIADCTYMKYRMGSKITTKVESNGSVTEATAEILESTTAGDLQVAVIADDAGNKQFLSCEGDVVFLGIEDATTASGVRIEDLLVKYDLGHPIGQEYLAAELVTELESYGQMFTNINRYNAMVVETGATMEVEGKVYTDVVQLEINIFTTLVGYGDPIHTVKAIYYFAPEVGNIQAEFFDVSTGYEFKTFTSTLVNYEY